MRTSLLRLIGLSLLATGSTATLAQTPAPPIAEPRVIMDQGSAAGSVGAGVGLGVAGFLVGGLVAVAIAGDCTGDMCNAEPALLGAAAGGTLGLALGAHLGNHRRGNFALDFATGAAVWGAGLGIAVASDWNESAVTAVAVMVPIAQLVGTVMVERAVGRSRSKRQQMSVSVAPDLHGGARVAASVPF